MVKKQLLELDKEFRESHIDILKRFYLLFESIYKYVADYARYIEDLQQGVFIQLTIEVIFSFHVFSYFIFIY